MSLSASKGVLRKLNQGASRIAMDAVVGNNVPSEITADTPDRIISMKAAVERTGWSRTSVYRLVQEDRFPRPVKMGWKIGFVEREINEYLADKVRSRDAASQRASLA